MPVGRPTKLTPELIIQICEYIQKGNYRSVAAKACGVPASTWNLWIKNGKEFPDGLYGQLLDFVQIAEGAAETAAVQAICSHPDPKHLQWWLARKYPHRWGADRLDYSEIAERLSALEEKQGNDEGSDSEA